MLERRYKMIKKFKDYLEHDYRGLDSYADSFVELIALSFMFVVWFLSVAIIVVALFVTCPLWIIPYSIYKSSKEDAEPLPAPYKEGCE